MSLASGRALSARALARSAADVSASFAVAHMRALQGLVRARKAASQCARPPPGCPLQQWPVRPPRPAFWPRLRSTRPQHAVHGSASSNSSTGQLQCNSQGMHRGRSLCRCYSHLYTEVLLELAVGVTRLQPGGKATSDVLPPMMRVQLGQHCTGAHVPGGWNRRLMARRPAMTDQAFPYWFTARQSI